MISFLGLKHEGRHHSGIDDVTNIKEDNPKIESSTVASNFSFKSIEKNQIEKN